MCQSKAAGGRRCPVHQPGTRAILGVLTAKHDLDAEQTRAVFRKERKRARVPANDPTQTEWDSFIDGQLRALVLNPEVDPQDFDRCARDLHAARSHVPDARTFVTLQGIDLRAEKAVKAVRRQINSAAALHGVDPDVAAERYEAFRDQYRRVYSRMPAAERPAPPDEWVTGFTTIDMMAVSAPHDKATQWAMYRCQADPDAFGGGGPQGFASIDLETAGPEGKAGFNPENGSIIEVGIIEYAHDGTETGRYSQLVSPDPEVARRCGTGAVAIHGITMQDVDGAPSWETVAPEVSARLANRAMLAQNARFEQDWLDHHLHSQGYDYDRWAPTVDTMCIARQHLANLPNRRLATICEEVGVAYTDGHRALHDADVTGKAFFALRNRITDTYAADARRQGLTQPPTGAGLRTNKFMTRMSAGDFTPSTVQDPWAAPVPA